MAVPIGDYASQAGISASAVRYYERVGLLPVAERRHGRRVYFETDVAKLKLVVAAREAGLSIRALQGITQTAGPTESSRTAVAHALRSRAEDVRCEIRKLERLHLLLTQASDCACASLSACSKAGQFVSFAS